MKDYLYTSMHFVNDSNDFISLLDFITKQPFLVIDTETSGLDVWNNDSVCAIGLGNVNHQFFLDLRLSVFDLSRLFNVICKVPVIVGHNIKFDLAGLYRLGYDPPYEQSIHDTIVMARLITFNQFPRLDLNNLMDTYIAPESSIYELRFKELMKENKIKQYSKVDTESLGIYCMNDVFYAARLYSFFKYKLDGSRYKDIWLQESKVSKVSWDMEKHGLHIDTDYCKYAMDILNIKSAKLQLDINQVYGSSVNLSSNIQVNNLFKKLGISSPIKTEKLADSWSQKALASVDHPVAAKISDWRNMQKMVNTYFLPYLERENPLHCTVKNWGTVTGRFSYANPNFQNIPKVNIPIFDNDNIDTEYSATIRNMLVSDEKRKSGQSVFYRASLSHGLDIFDDNKSISVRRAIVPKEGNVFLSYDYAQMEMRILFYYLDSPELDGYLRDRNWDGHSWVAEHVWGVDKSQSNCKMFRDLAKSINFGVIYGEGDTLLAAQINRTVEEAQAFREEYYNRIPGIKSFIRSLKDTLKKRGFIFNKFGRLYSVQDERSYVLLNYLIQGTSADFVKNRMCVIYDHLLSRQGLINQVLQVHDEIVIECSRDAVEECAFLIKDILEEPILRISLPVDLNICYPSYVHKIKYDKFLALFPPMLRQGVI